MTLTDQDFISLEARVSVLEERLGIDPAAVIADVAASNAAGAEAHEGNPVSDVPAPAIPDSAEDALTAASEAETASEALDHVNRALDRWPDDEDLQRAKGNLESIVAAELAEAEQQS